MGGDEGWVVVDCFVGGGGEVEGCEGGDGGGCCGDCGGCR